MVSMRGHRVWRVGVLAAGFLVGMAWPADAQSSIGFVGGGSIDPEQPYIGVFFQSPPLGGPLRVRPGIDGGFGSDLRLGTVNIDLVVSFPLGATGWSLVQGGGPTISILSIQDGRAGYGAREVSAGGSYLFGFAHDSGFFTEFRVGGGGYVPGLKVGAGWALTLK